MKLRFLKIGLPSVLGLLGAALAAGQVQAQVTTESQDVIGQGLAGPVVAMNGAKLSRSSTGLNVSLRMPAPEPGSYNYPPGNAFNPTAVPGPPEAFSLWLFAFNQPGDCLSDPCDLADFFAGRGDGGAFNAAGHIVGVGGQNLQLSGRVSLNSEPFLGSFLMEPMTAEVHLAVAPHGLVNPEFMPAQIQTPIGDPSYWWFALFLPD